jgi:cellulose 1,4-beta-cellobiosidase
MKRIVLSILVVSIFALCFVHTASAQVTNLQAVYDSDTSVKITWTYSGTAKSLTISKSTSATGPFTLFATVILGSGITGYRDTSVTKQVIPFYRVSSGQEANPPIVQATIPPVPNTVDPNAATGRLSNPLAGLSPGPPSGVVATAGNGQVALTWTAENIEGITYNVKSSLSSAGPFNVIASQVQVPNFTVTGLPNGTPRYFVVSAVLNGAETANSSVVTATPAVRLTAPTGLNGKGVDAGQISLFWNALAGATSYSIKMSKTSGGPYTTLKSGLTATTFDATGLTKSTTYFFVVSATNSVGESPNSPQIQVTTPNFIL